MKQDRQEILSLIVEAASNITGYTDDQLLHSPTAGTDLAMVRAACFQVAIGQGVSNYEIAMYFHKHISWCSRLPEHILKFYEPQECYPILRANIIKEMSQVLEERKKRAAQKELDAHSQPTVGLWNFTGEENREMYLAELEAARYMATIGKSSNTYQDRGI